MTPTDFKTWAEEKARELQESYKNACFRSAMAYPKPAPEPTPLAVLAAALIEAHDKVTERDARIAEAERKRQVDGDRFDKLSGEDTAFHLATTIRSLRLTPEEIGGGNG